MGAPRRAPSTISHRRRGGRGESGGAISLWVVLMVPVSAFAAVVAMAGPQRMAAESTMQDAADDLAMLAVAWRDGQGAAPGDMEQGPLHAFWPDCDTAGQTTHFDPNIEAIQALIDSLQQQINALPPGDPQRQPLEQQKQAEEARKQPIVDRRNLLLDDWAEACDLLVESLLRDLGYLGVSMNSLEGFYSDSMTTSTLPPGARPPCAAADFRASVGVKVEDAVHVALVADWREAGWAAAQVWPDGTRVAAESVGRLARRADTTLDLDCGETLAVHDTQGRPVLEPPQRASRELSRSVPRVSLSG